jgi:hypothetical protein
MGFFQGDVPTSVLGTGAQSAGAGAAKPGFMDNPLAYMKDNRFTVGASALAGAMGARKALGMPEQGAYKGSLSRYQFDPDKYQAADYGRYSAQGYAGGGIADINTSNIRNVPSISSYQGPVQTFAAGGIGQLGAYSDGGHMLKGPGDGMSDSIPASIADKKPARLADGEFVIPADVVSHLGNGSTDAGAKQLYAMMDRVRQKRTGTTKQGRQIKPQKLVPA